MVYKEFLPSKHLEEIVGNYWCFEVLEDENLHFPIQHETLPESSVSIVFIQQPYYSGIRILGPRTEKYDQAVFPNAIFFGIRLHPWLLMQPSLFQKHEIINETTEASAVITNHLMMPDDLKTYTSSLAIIENELLKLFRSVIVQKDDLVQFICLELSQGTPIHSIIEKIPRSVRVIQKRFKSVVGISMRHFASNLKQRKLWIDLLEKQDNKTAIILKHNYYDQAHFINEFKRKMKRSVADYESYLKTIQISLSGI